MVCGSDGRRCHRRCVRGGHTGHACRDGRHDMHLRFPRSYGSRPPAVMATEARPEPSFRSLVNFSGHNTLILSGLHAVAAGSRGFMRINKRKPSREKNTNQGSHRKLLTTANISFRTRIVRRAANERVNSGMPVSGMHIIWLIGCPRPALTLCDAVL